ncbi:MULTISPECIES: protein-export chaperone SecB [Levilactobacillus]|uniref:protein-export chaperone SecB n=1 Tax=Levilactobacillus TaxID=2767886 RepID=UPI0019510A29|nr:protein-export chaperone SecB [Levilactobacillus sp. 244-2]
MAKKLELSDLKLTGISVLDSEFSRNIAVDFQHWQQENDNYEFSIVPTLANAKNDANSARVILEAQLFSKDFKERDKPFYMRVKTAFYFQDTADYQDGSTVLDKYAANMISMAFPYVRAYIQTVTSLSGISSVTVPGINVFKLMEDMSKESDL